MLAGVAALLAAGGAQAAEPPWTLQRALGSPSNLTVSGSARLRYEVIDGGMRPDFSNSEDLLLLRTTVFAEYRTGPLKIGGEIYDSRAWGADNRGADLGVSEINALEPVQAYVAADLGRVLDPILGEGSSTELRLGRMMLNLGSGRLVAADYFRNATNAFTGAKLEAKAPGGAGLTLIYTQPQRRLPGDLASLRAYRVQLDKESSHLTFWGGMVGKSGVIGPAALTVQYFRLDERDSPDRVTRDRQLDTYGAQLLVAPGPGRFDYDIEAFRQTGRISVSTAPGAATQGVSAYLLHAEAGYQWAGGWKPRLSLEYDQTSGDRPGGRYNRFDVLFGQRRIDFARGNILTAGARVEAWPDVRWNVSAFYAPMWLDGKADTFSFTQVRDPSGRSGRFAGHLSVGTLGYWIVPANLRFDLVGVLIAKGRFLETAPNAPRSGDMIFALAALTATF